MNPDNRRLFLRQATDAAHRKVEQSAGPISSHADYRRYLAGLFEFRTPVDRALEGYAWPAVVGSWRPKRIDQLVACDLADLGCDPENAKNVPAMSNDISELFGVLYVTEGSALGARVILRKANALGFDETRGARHLSAQVNDAENWKDFVALLDRAPEFDPARAASAANRTFSAAALAFERASRCR